MCPQVLHVPTPPALLLGGWNRLSIKMVSRHIVLYSVIVTVSLLFCTLNQTNRSDDKKPKYVTRLIPKLKLKKWAIFDENPKGLTLLFIPKFNLKKWAIFDENPKGLTLLFIPKLNLKKWAIFYENPKGLTLLFIPKLKLKKWPIFDENPKGLTLLFIPKLNPKKMSYFWWKS